MPWHRHTRSTESVADVTGLKKCGELPSYPDAAPRDLCFLGLNLALCFYTVPG